MDDLPGELDGYGPIPAALARAIAADRSGTWRRLLTDPTGVLTNSSRTYRPPTELAEFVRARDRTCNPHGQITWTSPTGHTYRSPPARYD
jgi:hypothetical protein